MEEYEKELGKNDPPWLLKSLNKTTAVVDIKENKKSYPPWSSNVPIHNETGTYGIKWQVTRLFQFKLANSGNGWMSICVFQQRVYGKSEWLFKSIIDQTRGIKYQEHPLLE